MEQKLSVQHLLPLLIKVNDPLDAANAVFFLFTRMIAIFNKWKVQLLALFSVLLYVKKSSMTTRK